MDGRTRLGAIPEDWRAIPLRDGARIASGRSPEYSTDGAGEFPVLGANGQIGMSNRANVTGGIVVGRVGASGSVARITGPAWVSDNALHLLAGESVWDESYLFHALVAARLPELASKTAQPLITQSGLGAVVLPCPELCEQEQIAETLDAIDEAIGTTETVIAATENLRKALLQELLTRGVPGWHTAWKTVPGIGTIPACWEVVRLGEVAQVRNGTTPSKARADFWSAQGFPFIRTGQVNDRVITRGEQFLTEAGLRNRAVVVPKGSVLIAMIGQGKTRGMAAKLAVTAAINQNFAAVTTLDRLDSNYFYTWADHNYEGLRGLGQGSNQGALNCGLIASMPVPLPTIPEQRHIAESVAAIDSRGAAEQHHLDSLKHAKDLWADTLLSGRVRIPTRKVAP